MPRRGRSRSQVPIDVDGVESDPEGNSKLSRTSRKPAAAKMRGRSSNALTSDLPRTRSSNRVVSSNRDKTNEDKLDTLVFELYLENLWKRIDENKKSAYTYFDSLWFTKYNSGQDKSDKTKVLQWIKAKKIFTRQYVFVPIVCWGHWSLLILCHFDEANCSDAKKGPRMLLLDSLNTTGWIRLQSPIRRFIHDIYKMEEREESKRFIDKIRLEVPKVPQQTGEECGIYVLYFINCFLHNKQVIEALENKKLEEDFRQLVDDGCFDPEDLENFRKDVHSFQADLKAKSAE